MTPASSPAKAAPGLFLQEWAFGILLVYLALRGWVQLGPTDPAAWIPATLLAVDAALIRWDFRQNSVVSGRCRLLFHAIAMNIVYWRLGQDVPRFHDATADSWLLRIDRRWLGETPALGLAPIVHPALTEILSGCYLLFYPAMVGYQGVWIFATPSLARRFFAGLYLVYAVGFVCYTLAPAKGPWIHLASSFEPLKGGPLTALTDLVVRNGCNGVDVFPSLHTGNFVIILNQQKTKARLAKFLLTACLTINMSSVSVLRVPPTWFCYFLTRFLKHALFLMVSSVSEWWVRFSLQSLKSSQVG